MRSLFFPLALAVALCSPFAADRAISRPIQLAPELPEPPAPIAAQAEPAGPLTLDAALALAAAGSFPLSAAAREVDASEGAIMQARVIPNPEISGLMEGTRRDTRTTTGLASLPIELGGKRAARIGAAERGRDLAQAQLTTARAELRASVITAFFGVLIGQERVRVAASSLDIAANGARAASRRVTAGKISPVEETKAQVEQANAALELDEAAAALEAARITLAAQWGNGAARFGEAVGNLDALPDRPAPETLLADLDGSPMLLASRLERERREAMVEVERSRRYPDVTVSVGAKRDSEANRNMAVLGVAIPLPLFDRNQGNLYEAMRRADKAQDEYAASRVRLTQALRQAANQLAVSRRSAEALRHIVMPAAQLAYDAATTGFEAGKFTFLDVLDAQRTLLQARIRYLGVVARTYESAASIDRILGR
jgi:cobalt-zinc-cadmium efflux system outer membrane protein